MMILHPTRLKALRLRINRRVSSFLGLKNILDIIWPSSTFVVFITPLLESFVISCSMCAMSFSPYELPRPQALIKNFMRVTI